jgi:predicted ATPase/DNA-binding winged helix-turn-helix (wHTH) protein
VPDTLLTFGPFELSPTRRSLVRDGKAVRLGNRAFDLLIALAERAGDVVGKEEVIERVWPDTYVEETNLRVHIAALRKILGDGGAGERFISTVPGRGYSFVAQVARRQDAAAAAGAVDTPQAVHNLPAPLTRTIGRDQVVGLIAAQLPRRRFVTIVGPGGIGKTTVALAVAGNLVGTYADRVCFVDLAPLADARLVPTAFAAVLGVAPGAGDPLPGLLAHLRNKSMLVVLDNCEHVIESAAALAEGIRAGAPEVHVLATSREPFRAAGEWVHRLSTLAVPRHPVRLSRADALAFSAVELFAERATAALDTFELTDGNVGTVCDICRRLDGIPLAIELAAVHVELFGLREFAARLSDCFSLLTAGRRTALPRHRTLQATLDWSHGLLSVTEQIVFRRLARMAGAFTMASAVAVTAGDGVAASDVPEVMAGLITKSLVATDVGGDAIQYRLLETTRTYAAEKLARSDDAAPVARRYAIYFRDLMRRGEAEWKAEANRPGWLTFYAGSIDDVRAAMDWAFSPSGDLATGLDLTAASAQLWFQLSLMAEYRERIDRALQCLQAAPAPDPVMEMQLQAALGHALWYAAYEPDTLERAFKRALALAEQVDDSHVQLQALWGLWAARRGRGEFRSALTVATRYEAIARESGDQRFTALSDRILGLTEHFLGNHVAARRRLERVRSAARGAGQQLSADFQLSPEVAAATLLARILWLQGFPERAVATAREAIEAAQKADHWFSVCYVTCIAAGQVSLWVGDLVETQRHIDVLTDRAASIAAMDQWKRCFAQIVRLRQGSDRDALVASFVEPRLDLSTVVGLLAFVSAPAIQMPVPDAEPADALWSLPEVLRVDAGLLLWHGGPGAAEAAEAKLLRSLDFARQQSALSWELRSAMSLARLWRGGPRAAEAHDLLAATYARFTEGFNTVDLVDARRLLDGAE